MDANGLPVRAIITEGSTADCTKAAELIDGIEANFLLSDRGYDSDKIIEEAQKQGTISVIPPRKNRLIQRKYDKNLYKKRHLFENAFLYIKRWRDIATSYAEKHKSFLAAVQIRSLTLWLSIS